MRKLLLSLLLALTPSLAFAQIPLSGPSLRLYDADSSHYVATLPPATTTANRTCQLEDDATPFDQCITPDLTDVWGCSSGDCDALTAASGDSIDAALADSARPFARSATLPGTCTEGDTFHDTDSGGSELHVCTATDTWTKLTTAADIQGTANEVGVTGAGPTVSIADTFRITGKDATAPVKAGTDAPGSCTLGDLFLDTDATAGDNLQICTATDTWTTVDGASMASGDIEAVWDCASGDCSALTAAAGDSLDATGADSTAPVKTGTSAPGTCTVGQIFFDTDATAGENLFGCTATDTWTLLGDGGGAGSGDIEAVFGCASGDCSTLTAAAGDSLNMGSGDSSAPCPSGTALPGSCTEGHCFQDTDSTGSELYICTATNTWTRLGRSMWLGTTGTVTLPTSGTAYGIISGALSANVNENEREQVAPAAGVVQHLRIDLVTAPGAGTSRTFTVRVNGSNSALACTVSDAATTCSDTADNVSFAAGDILTLGFTLSGTPVASSASWGMVVLQ